MKITLSIPSTISSAVNVSSAIHASLLVKRSSNVEFPFRENVSGPNGVSRPRRARDKEHYAGAVAFSEGYSGIGGGVCGQTFAFTVSFVAAHKSLSRVTARNWTLRGFGIDRRVRRSSPGESGVVGRQRGGDRSRGAGPRAKRQAARHFAGR